MKQDLVFVDGFKVRRLRKEKKWTQKELSFGGPEGKEEIFSKKTLEKIEKSDPANPTQHEWRIVDDIASSLSISVDELIVGEKILSTKFGHTKEDFDGVLSASTGIGRVEAFQAIRDRAKKRIIVVGIGMSQITSYARKSLARQAESVPIEFLMLDPVYLENNPAFAEELQKFLAIRDFSRVARASYDFLEGFVTKLNQTTKNKHSLRVYSTIPTMSMVMIDPDTSHGEVVIEFFLHQSGEYRPRFHIQTTGRKDDLFSHFSDEYERLCREARVVV